MSGHQLRLGQLVARGEREHQRPAAVLRLLHHDVDSYLVEDRVPAAARVLLLAVNRIQSLDSVQQYDSLSATYRPHPLTAVRSLNFSATHRTAVAAAFKQGMRQATRTDK